MDWAGARLMAGWLVEAAQPSSGGSDVARFFSTLARYLVAPLLHAAALDGRPVADVLAWVKSPDRDTAEAILTDAGADAALADLRVTRDWAAETRTGLVATALVLLSVYDDPQVSASAETCAVDADEILDAAGTLYLVAPLHSQERFRPLFEAMTMQLVRAAQDRAQAGQPVDPGLLLMLDECGTTAPLRQLPQLAATGRGQSIQLVSVWQSLGQVRERYGLQLAESVVTNHRAQLALAGISDLATLDHFSRLLGDTETDRTSTTRQAQGGRSVSVAPQTQQLVPADQLRQLKVGQALLVYGSLPPAMLRLRRHPAR